MEQILIDLALVFRDVLDDDTIILKEETTAADIEEWDSLTHIMLISEIEKKFKIRFTSSEIIRFKNVGEMASSILSKRDS
jgi:acyl carrier protein